MGVIVIILVLIGLIVSLIGWIWFLYVAFNESIPWGVACLLNLFLPILPVVPIIFLVMHGRDAGKPFGVALLGWVIAVVALVIMPRGAARGATTVTWSIAKPAPSFTLQDLDGKQVSLSDFKGNVVILDFWATSCRPCAKEIPHFVALHEQYKDQGFAMVGISLDSKGVSVVKSFAEKHQINYPILIADGQVKEAYGGIKSIPTTFVIDAAGNLKRKYVGYRDKAVFEADVKSFLAEAESEAKPVRAASPKPTATTVAASAPKPYAITAQDEISRTRSSPEKLTSIENEEADTTKTDYVTELNRIGIAGRPENLNAAPYYETAMKLYVEQPKELEMLGRQAWPADLSAKEQLLLKEWVQSNAEALSQLELGAKRSYYWVQRSSPDGTVMKIEIPELPKFRQLCFAICWRAKLAAAEGNIDKAAQDIATCYRFGSHVTGPRFLTEQLVAIAIRAKALQTAFDILDRGKLDKASMEFLQSQIEQLSTGESYVPDMQAEKFGWLDFIQRVFTDDGTGDGRIDATAANRLLSQSGMAMPPIFQKLSRRQTIETIEKVYGYFDFVARKNPAQWENEKIDPDKEIEKITEGNALVQMLCQVPTKVVEMFARCRADTDALITTLALLRYKADKGGYPQRLDELVSSGYVKAVPIDPFSDKAFVYQRVADDFILYSFGRDCDDDGGDALRDSEGRPKKWADAGDAVFWPVEGQKRAEEQQTRPRPVAGPVLEKPTMLLHDAVTGGDLEQVQLHIAQRTDVNKKDQMGLAPLFYAVQGDKKDIAQVLIDGGADINGTDQYGNTPLHLAAMGGHYAMCELLVAKGADVAAKNLMGGTPVGMARAGGHEQVAALLSRPTVERRDFARMADRIPQIERSPVQTTGAQTAASTQSLHQAAVDGDIEQVQSLISKGADVQAKNRLGWTPLHTAVRNQKKTVAEFLIDKGADISAKDSSGQTPLHSAVETGQKDMAELLIAKGADINTVSGRGENALSLAKTGGHTEIVDFLLKHGAKEPTLDLTGDRMYRLEEGSERPSPPADLPRQVQPEAAPGVRSDPNAVANILADPNEIVARVKAFEGLEKSLELVNGRSRYEVQEWLQRRTDDRIDLAKAVYRQAAGEIRLIRDVATEEKAKKTTDAASNLLSHQQKRLKTLVEDMEEEMRALRPTRGTRGTRSTRGPRGRYGGRYPSAGQGYPQEEGVGGRTSTYSSGTRMPGQGLRGQDALMRQGAAPGTPGDASADTLDRDEIALDAWLQGDFDGKIELAKAVHNQTSGQIVSIRKVAVDEEAKKTTAAIDGILLDRQKRFEKLVAEMEEAAEELRGSYRSGYGARGQTYPQDNYSGTETGQTGSTGELPRRRR